MRFPWLLKACLVMISPWSHQSAVLGLGIVSLVFRQCLTRVFIKVSFHLESEGRYPSFALILSQESLLRSFCHQRLKKVLCSLTLKGQVLKTQALFEFKESTFTFLPLVIFAELLIACHINPVLVSVGLLYKCFHQSSSLYGTNGDAVLKDREKWIFLDSEDRKRKTDFLGLDLAFVHKVEESFSSFEVLFACWERLIYAFELFLKLIGSYRVEIYSLNRVRHSN